MREIILYYLFVTLKWVVGIAVTVSAIVLGAMWFLYGEGEPFPRSEGTANWEDALQSVAVLDIPPGDVAVTTDRRIFFLRHPLADISGAKLYELTAEGTRPWPSEGAQAQFEMPTDLAVDAEGQLWVLDAGNHGFGTPTLRAFDLEAGEETHAKTLEDVASYGSYLQAMELGVDGDVIYIADTGFLAKRPALIVYEPETGQARRALSRHESTLPQNWLIRTALGDLSYYYGFFSIKAGAAALALSPDGGALYYGATNHNTLYRVPTAALRNPALPAVSLNAEVELVGRKPQSDAMTSDNERSVYISDIERGAILRYDVDLNNQRSTETLIVDDRLRWVESMSFGPQGWIYIADSALPALILKDEAEIRAAGPFHIWRFQSERTGRVGR